jgi:hypothetical protein
MQGSKPELAFLVQVLWVKINHCVFGTEADFELYCIDADS